MGRSGKFSWWRLTCILLVLAGLLHVPAALAVTDTSPGDGELAIVMPAEVHDEIPLATQGDLVRVVRPERLLERVVEPVADSPMLRGAPLDLREESGVGASTGCSTASNPVAHVVGVVELRL